MTDKKTMIKRCFTAVLMAAMTIPSLSQNMAVFASGDTAALNAELNEVKITSVKTNRHNLTPASVSMVGSATLRTQPITDVAEISSIVPNFFIPEYGSKQTTPIAIRGVMSKVKGTSVGFYIDGVPHFEVSSFDSDLLDVKGIEVFRGPQGTLYGRNTLAGVINIYTYSPFESEATTIKAGYGNYNSYNIKASHRNRINDIFGFTLNGYYKHKGGYFTNEYLDKKADPCDEAGGKIGLYFRPTDNLTVGVTSNYDYLNQGGYPYSKYDAETGKLAPVSYNRECGFERRISTNGLNIRYANDIFSLNSQTTVQINKENMDMDQDYSVEDIYYTQLDTKQHAVSEELTMKSETSSDLQWVAGLFCYHQSKEYLSSTIYIQKGYVSTIDYEMPTTGFAAFAQVSYNIWHGLSATAGLRFDYEKSEDEYESRRVSGNERTGKGFESELSTTDLMPKFGLQYKWKGNNVVFGNITRGCKAGGFNSVFESDEERTYDDEYNWNYEVGFKMGSHNRRVEGDMTLFYIDWRHQHISRMVPGLGTIICNAGHSQSKGVEASVSVCPVTGLLVNVNYGHTYAKFLDYKKSDTQDYSGNMTPMIPRNTLSGIVSYTIAPMRGLDLITIGANVNCVGKLYWLEDNKQSQSTYATLGAKLSLTKSIVTLDIWGKNITDTDYLSYYFVSTAKYAQDGVPATFGANVNVKF